MVDLDDMILYIILSSTFRGRLHGELSTPGLNSAQPRPQGLLRKEAKGSEGPGKGW